ncbi:MAG: hypothetical protein IPJ50_10295 [Betaproteobacteria bacterium]|nr:hypothetical protein [Betaproteobacteria bacterium]
MKTKSGYDNYAKGAGGFGSMGQPVSADWVLDHGSRGQKRRLERQMKKEFARNNPQQGGKK